MDGFLKQCYKIVFVYWKFFSSSIWVKKKKKFITEIKLKFFFPKSGYSVEFLIYIWNIFRMNLINSSINPLYLYNAIT